MSYPNARTKLYLAFNSTRTLSPSPSSPRPLCSRRTLVILCFLFLSFAAAQLSTQRTTPCRSPLLRFLYNFLQHCHRSLPPPAVHIATRPIQHHTHPPAIHPTPA